MALILITEDDPTTRMLHARALTNLEGHTVVTAGCLADAQAMLDGCAPDLVLLDLRLPDGSGLDVLRMLQERRSHAPVMIVSAFTEDLPEALVSAAPLAILRKPVSPVELRCQVLERLQLQRKTSEFTLPEYLQMACLGKHSVMLSVMGPRAGAVAVRAGEVWAASYGPKKSSEAFYAMAALQDCAIEVLPWPEHEVPRELTGGYEELLLEAARREDEAAQGGSPSPPEAQEAETELDFSGLLDAQDETGSAGVGTRQAVADLVGQTVRAVIARDHQRAVSLLEQALDLDPGNGGLRQWLERLYKLELPAAEGEAQLPKVAAGGRS